MTFIYWLTFVLGGGMFLLSLAGELLGAHGVEHGDPDLDLHHGGADFDWGKLFSLRYLTYLLFGFGATGVLLSMLWSGERDLLVAAAAAIAGAGAWLLSAAVFGWLKRTESGELQGDRTLIGRVGEVTLPIVSGGTGKVLVTRSGQTQELLAKPMDASESGVESWSSVVIVEMRDGVAFVAPYSESEES